MSKKVESRWYEETHGPWSRVYPDKAEFVPGSLSALMHRRYSCNFTHRILLFAQNLHTTHDYAKCLQETTGTVCIFPKFISPKCIFPKCISPKCNFSKVYFPKTGCTHLLCFPSFCTILLSMMSNSCFWSEGLPCAMYIFVILILSVLNSNVQYLRPLWIYLTKY